MKKILVAALLAVGFAGSAFAQAVNGDLIMGFRDDGSDGGTGTSSNLTINLGLFNQFEAGGAFYSPGVAVNTGINLTTDGVGTLYGGSYLTDTGLLWGVVGTNTGSNNELFVTAAAPGGIAGSSTPWLDRSNTSQSSQHSIFATFVAQQGSNPVLIASTSTSTSWSFKEGTSSVAFGAYNKSLFEASSTNGDVADLYDLPTTTGVPGVLLGSFSLDSSGNVDFTAAGAAIPEPSTYAAILGAAVLAVAIYRRRQHSLAL